MVETSLTASSALTDRSVAVALIVLTRYLTARDPDLLAYLTAALAQARRSSLLEADLATLRLLIGSIGG